MKTRQHSTALTLVLAFLAIILGSNFAPAFGKEKPGNSNSMGIPEQKAAAPAPELVVSSQDEFTGFITFLEETLPQTIEEATNSNDWQKLALITFEEILFPNQRGNEVQRAENNWAQRQLFVKKVALSLIKDPKKKADLEYLSRYIVIMQAIHSGNLKIIIKEGNKTRLGTPNDFAKILFYEALKPMPQMPGEPPTTQPEPKTKPDKKSQQKQERQSDERKPQYS